MDPIFAAAIENIRRMEGRIRNQKLAIERLNIERRDISDATRRLALLTSALEEMRTQLAHLTPTKEQVSAPVWALPFMTAPKVEERPRDAIT